MSRNDSVDKWNILVILLLMPRVNTSTNFDPYSNQEGKSLESTIPPPVGPGHVIPAAPIPVEKQPEAQDQPKKRLSIPKIDAIKSLGFAINRLACFILMAMMSFIFYSTLAGSNVFFYWFNGIVGVAFDVKMIQLWDDGKRWWAALFIAFAVFAFAGSSIMETSRASIRVDDGFTKTYLENKITEYDSLIAQQKKRIADTPDTMAPVRESEILDGFVTTQQGFVKELQKYSKESMSDSSLVSFSLLAGIIGMKNNETMLVWIFFIFRAVLLQVSVLYSSPRKMGQQEPSPPIAKESEKSAPKMVIRFNAILAESIHQWIKAWRENAQKEKKIAALDRLNTLENYIHDLESVVKEEIDARSEPAPITHAGDTTGIRSDEVRGILPRKRVAESGRRIKSLFRK
jgi:hypothetical protein